MDDLPQMTEGEWVRQSRRKLNLRQSDVASVLGVARTSIVALEQGVVGLSRERYEKLRTIGFPPVIFIREPETEQPQANEWELLTAEERLLIAAVRDHDYREAMRLIVGMSD